MSKERELLERVLESRTFMQGVALRREIEELLTQPEQEPTNHMHEIFLHNLQNKEKLGEMIINLDGQYITLLGHKVVITEIIDREAYPVVGYFIDLNNDGEPRTNETGWDKNGDSAYCLDWRWGLTLDTSPNPDQEVFTNTRYPLRDDEIMILGKQNLCNEANLFKPVALSEEEIKEATKNMSEFGADMFKAGIMAAEKAHGIGE